MREGVRVPPGFSRFRRDRLCVAVLLLAAAVPCAAEEKAENLTWTIGGEARFRPELRDDADLVAAADDDRRLGLMRLRLGLRLAYRDEYRLFFQVQDARTAGEEASTASNEKNLDLHQGFIDLPLDAARSFTLQLGRQEWAYGDERLIGAFGWDNIGRAFDGARLRFSPGHGFVDAFAARLTSRLTGPATTGSELYGVYARLVPRAGAEYEPYLIGFHDGAAAAGETGASGTSRVHAAGVRIRDRFGPIDLRFEAAVERGATRGDDLRAGAAGLQAGWSRGQRRVWRLFAGYDLATGDADPADGEAQEFFNFFPTNHPHYGYADSFGWRNLRSPYGGVSFTGGRHFAQAKRHAFHLDEARGPWKDAGGAVLGSDPSGASGTEVGAEVDLTYRFSWSATRAVEVGYSRFEPRRFARNTRGADASDWAYAMATFGF